MSSGTGARRPVADAGVAHQRPQHLPLCAGAATRLVVRTLELLAAASGQGILLSRATYAIFYYFHIMAVGQFTWIVILHITLCKHPCCHTYSSIIHRRPHP